MLSWCPFTAGGFLLTCVAEPFILAQESGLLLSTLTAPEYAASSFGSEVLPSDLAMISPQVSTRHRQREKTAFLMDFRELGFTARTAVAGIYCQFLSNT